MIRARLISLLLVLNLGLATLGFGVARGQAPAAGQMVICTGQGIVTVTIDAEGKPVASHSLCPDAALLFFAATAVPVPQALPCAAGLVWRDWPQMAQAHVVTQSARLGARGPPEGLRA